MGYVEGHGPDQTQFRQDVGCLRSVEESMMDSIKAGNGLILHFHRPVRQLQCQISEPDLSTKRPIPPLRPNSPRPSFPANLPYCSIPSGSSLSIIKHPRVPMYSRSRILDVQSPLVLNTNVSDNELSVIQ